MNSIIKLSNEVKDIKDKMNVTLNNKNIEISLLYLKALINSLYSNKKHYNKIIQQELLINNLSESIYNFFNIFNNNIGNKTLVKNNIISKHFSKFVRNINYINKYIFEGEGKFNEIKFNFNEKININNYWFVIDSVILLKNCINTNRHLFIKKYIKILLLFQFLEKISLNVCKFILEIYINIVRDLIIINNNYISFLDDLIGGIIDFIDKNENSDKNILSFIIEDNKFNEFE